MASKTLGDYTFSHVLIWVRVSGLPLGMMNRESGMAIGESFDGFIDVD